MITHVVFFKLKDPSPENIRKTKDVLSGMAGKIPQLLDLEVGIDMLRTERSHDLVLISRFNSLDDLQAYQVHPVHRKVLEYIGEVKDTTLAVDYES